MDCRRSNIIKLFGQIACSRLFSTATNDEREVQRDGLRQVHFVSRTVPLLAFRDLHSTGCISIVVEFDRWHRRGWSLLRLAEGSSWRHLHHLRCTLVLDASSLCTSNASVTRGAGTRVSFHRTHLGVTSSGSATRVRISFPFQGLTTFLHALGTR